MSCQPACPICSRLREAALELVGGGGTEALSHEALERAAGLPEGEAARHYPRVSGCLHETYMELSEQRMAEMAQTFSEAQSWDSAFALARSQLLAHMAAHPAEARLCLVETLRGDRRLRRLRDTRRRELVAFLDDQRLRFGGSSSRLQIELLVGAMFHEMSEAVDAGRTAELPALESRLHDLAHLFDPGGRTKAPRRPVPVVLGPKADGRPSRQQPAWSAARLT